MQKERQRQKNVDKKAHMLNSKKIGLSIPHTLEETHKQRARARGKTNNAKFTSRLNKQISIEIITIIMAIIYA